MSEPMRRALLILGVLAVLVGIGVADGGGGSASVGPSTPGGTSSVSSIGVPPIGAESSAWFCPGGTTAGGDAQATMILTDPTHRPVTATVTTVSTTAASTSAVPTSVAVPVPANGQIAVTPVPGPPGGWQASSVVFNGGGIGVTQVVSGPLGSSAAPCVSTTARHWYFADASTAPGDTLTLSLFNPSDTIAVVDVSFVVSTGVVAPPAYQGIDVPAHTVVVENVGDHVQNNPDLATAVVALSGEVVAAELEAAGPAGSGGPSVVLGTTASSTAWSFAQNTDVTNGGTLFHVFNPSDRPARVTVRIGLGQGEAEPLVMDVASDSVATLDTGGLARIPIDTPFAVTFVSAGGVGIVVDRHVSSPAGSPAPEAGDTAGVAGGAARWLLPAASPPFTGVSALAVVNLNREPVTVGLSMLSPAGLAPVPGFGHQRIGPGRPLIVSPSPGVPVGTVPMELVASAPVAVEVDAVPVGSPGVVVSPALPLR
ncbi:MAG TPA: DUF5719 family protein [Acidimicrobiales bacterium]|nr:DUF5719 family protein [Acidimicrobiales bacterium]